MTRAMKWLPRGLMVMAVSMLLVLACAATAHAATVTVKPPAGGDAYKAIQTQLDKAKNGKTKMNIVVKAGSYKLSHGLNVYSNTTLTLKGVKLTLSRSATSNVLKVGATQDTTKGYYYKNISIVGGDLSANKLGVTAVKIAHAKNVSLKGVTVRDTVNAHLMEVAGVSGLKIDSCTFKNQTQTKTARVLTPEAIQIDILVQRHMPGYRSQDLPMKNVTINKCTFSNVPRGVGSHTAVVNNPVNGIAITNNKFTNIKSTAIQGMYYINCTITGNVINSAPRGIALYSIFDKGTFLPSTTVKEGKVKTTTSSKYKTPAANQNIVIKNNKITAKGTDPFSGYVNDGICVIGLNVPKTMKKTAEQDAIPKGDYYLSGVTISGNTISSVGNGIRVLDTRNSTVSGNTISYTGKASSKTNYYGIQATLACKTLSLTGNTIKSSQSNGIYVNRSSSVSAITGNTVKAAGKYGIGIEQSTATKVASNAVSSSKKAGIFVYDSSKATSITGNTVTASQEAAIQVALNSTVGSVEGNTISAPKGVGIMAHKEATIQKIADNKISKSGMAGIGLYSAKANSSITGNTVANAGGYGIYVDAQTAPYTVTVKDNVLTGAGNASVVRAAKGSNVVTE